MVERRSQPRTGVRETWGGILLACFVLMLISLLSYDWHDIGYLAAPATVPPANLLGRAGALLAFGLFTSLGVAAYLLPFWAFVFGLGLILRPARRVWPSVIWAIVATVGFLILVDLASGWRPVAELCDQVNVGEASAGEVMRLLCRRLLVPTLNTTGTGILAACIVAVAILKLVGVRALLGVLGRVPPLAGRAGGRFGQALARWRAARKERDREREEAEKRRQKLKEAVAEDEDRKRARMKPARPEPVESAEPKRTLKEKLLPSKPTSRPEPKAAPTPRRKPRPAPAPVADGEQPAYHLPDLDLLDPLPPRADRGLEGDAETTSRVLQETLAEFGIEAEVTNVERGPVVTRYELLPAPGIRVERIAGLSNNLSLALKATSIRVQAPVPGKGVVGIEVPNATRSIVYLREIVESEAWLNSEAALPLALGQDVAGNDLVVDLAEMPHMLVAGATGAGKTVCINSILAGLLLARTPEQVRLMLVDPKIVEFTGFNHLPHLVVPVITNAKKVPLGLRWAINEMEKRYKMFAKVGVRNIATFNTRPIEEQQNLFADGKEGEGDPPAETAPEDIVPRTLPYIVIVVDELADLMLTDQAEIENCIARLAQLSRAVGIHMILATQRPSVNVITGTIKANFPSRIAFQVAQRTDSRTILDANGAETLLGKGDMLFVPAGANRLLRVQGAMIGDAELKKVVQFAKEQRPPTYVSEVKEQIESKAVALPDGGEDDELLEASIQVIRETHRASTSSLQRRLRIGYTRAARIMDILEGKGIVGPPRGSEPREILIDLDGDIPENPE